ncbi:hypothetical protein K438DRAFT_1972386 [Mycena galopus ATCC 62051]|nr:hypothetical protein K438DRAFT_1972386 [Mycena galopus ATCC 62051]
MTSLEHITFEYLDTNKKLDKGCLNAIIQANGGRTMAGKVAEPRSHIAGLGLDIDWGYIMTKPFQKDPTRLVDNLFLSYVSDGRVQLPASTPSSPLSSTSDSSVKWPERPERPKQPPRTEGEVSPTGEEELQMDVDQEQEEKIFTNDPFEGHLLAGQSGPLVQLQNALDNLHHGSKRFQLVSKAQLFQGKNLYNALNAGLASDQLWRIGILIRDCSHDVGNQTTYFYGGTELHLHQVMYGYTDFYAKTKDVVAFLKEYDLFPPAPWDLFWVFPGFSWTVGPFTRLNSDAEEVQLDQSRVELQQIPVQGTDTCLRIMLFFKHPMFGSNTYAGLPWLKKEETAIPDVKPSLKKSTTTPLSQEKNDKIQQFMINHLLTVGEYTTIFADLRAYPAKQSADIKRTSEWVKMIGTLRSTYQETAAFPGMPPSYVVQKRIPAQNWEVVLKRRSIWLAQAATAYSHLQDAEKIFEEDEDFRAFLKDDKLTVSIQTFGTYIFAQGMFTLREINQVECEMCNYLNWELTVDNLILANFEAMVQRDFPPGSKGPYPSYSLHMVSKRAAKVPASASRNQIPPRAPTCVK